MSEEIIRTVGLTKRYGEKTAVKQLNLTIKRGEVFGLLGPNGAGKTTTTLMLLGLTDPTEGFATIEGMDCTRDPTGVKRIVGYLPDNVGFYSDMTGRENLRFTGRLNGLGGDALEARLDGLLRRVGLAEAADRKAGTYSRGMRQRLGLAQALMEDPGLLILDEPFNGLDKNGVLHIRNLIKYLRSQGKTVILASHNQMDIDELSDTVCEMDGGILTVVR